MVSIIKWFRTQGTQWAIFLFGSTVGIWCGVQYPPPTEHSFYEQLLIIAMVGLVIFIISFTLNTKARFKSSLKDKEVKE